MPDNSTAHTLYVDTPLVSFFDVLCGIAEVNPASFLLGAFSASMGNTSLAPFVDTYTTVWTL